MSRPLTGSWAKLQRAQEHFEALRAELDRIMKPETNPFEIASYFEPETSSYLFVIARLVSVTHVGLIIGDVLQNLRAALDHMIWELVSDGGIAEPTERTAFPFARDEPAWQSAKSDRLRGVPDTQLAIIERHQPKERGDWSNAWPLTVLGELSNQDKHRVIIPSLVFPVGVTFDNFEVVGCQLERVEPLLAQGRPLEVGTELARVFVSDLRAERGVNMLTTLQVRPAFSDGVDVRERLNTIRQTIVNVITEVELSLPKA
jgi:hypothetical protein